MPSQCVGHSWLVRPGRSCGSSVPPIWGPCALRSVVLAESAPADGHGHEGPGFGSARAPGNVSARAAWGINGYIEPFFVPRRTFAEPADLNAQSRQWLVRTNTWRVLFITTRPNDVGGEDVDFSASLIVPRLGMAFSGVRGLSVCGSSGDCGVDAV